jgi:lacto-N-biose phosphorylase-like protein
VTAKEKQFQNWLSHNINTGCTVYPETGNIAVTNNLPEKQKTLITGTNNEQIKIELSPYELKWLKMEELN